MPGNPILNVGKTVALALLTLMLVTLPVGCGTKAIEVDSVELNMTELTLSVGEVSQLAVSLFPVNATNRTVSWASNDESIASVDADGAIVAKASGTVTVTVTAVDTGQSAECTVVVTKPTGLEISPEDDEVYVC